MSRHQAAARVAIAIAILAGGGACSRPQLDELLRAEWGESNDPEKAQRLLEQVRTSATHDYAGPCHSEPPVTIGHPLRPFLEHAYWAQVVKFGTPPGWRRDGDYSLVAEFKDTGGVTYVMINLDLTRDGTCDGYRLSRTIYDY